MPETHSHSGRLWSLVVILLAYIAVNSALLFFASPDAPTEYGADAGSWLKPAQALLKHGAFVKLDDPETLQTYRPPLYPLFLAGLLRLAGGSFLPIILAQTVLLFGTGWLTRSIVEHQLPGYGDLALALIVFNPNAVSIAHLIQSDTVFAFLATAALSALFAFAQKQDIRFIVLTSLFFALATLVRTTGQFLLYVWPLMFPLIALVAGTGRFWKRYLIASLLSLVLVLTIFTPWMVHNYAANEGFSMSTARLKSKFFWDSIAYLEKYDHGITLDEAEAAGQVKRKAIAAAAGSNWARMSEREQYGLLIKRGIKVFFSYPPSTFVRAFAWSWAKFFGTTGVSNLNNILTLTKESKNHVSSLHYSIFYLQNRLNSIRNSDFLAITFTIIGFIFILLMRSFGLFGLLAMFNRRYWPQLLIVVGTITYFAFVHLFVGNSRYRLPIEPLLVLLALFGLDGLRQRRSRAQPGGNRSNSES